MSWLSIALWGLLVWAAIDEAKHPIFFKNATPVSSWANDPATGSIASGVGDDPGTGVAA